MNIDIRENIKSSLKTETTESLIEVLDETTNSDDEIVLPGLGVVFSLFWNALTNEDKEKLASLALKKMNY